MIVVSRKCFVLKVVASLPVFNLRNLNFGGLLSKEFQETAKTKVRDGYTVKEVQIIRISPNCFKK